MIQSSRTTHSANENLLHLLPAHEGCSVQSAHSKAEVHRAISLGRIQHFSSYAGFKPYHITENQIKT